MISADGTTIAFRSKATNLVPRGRTPATVAGSKPPPARHMFPFYLYDARTGRIQGASVDPVGVLRDTAPDATLSPDGRYAMFRIFEPGYGTDPDAMHKELYVRSTAGDGHQGGHSAARYQDRPRLLPHHHDGRQPLGGLRLGRRQSGSGDTNGVSDIFRRDLRTGGIERVGVADDGPQTSWPFSYPFVDGRGTTVLFDANGKVFARRLPPRCDRSAATPAGADRAGGNAVPRGGTSLPGPPWASGHARAAR